MCETALTDKADIGSCLTLDYMFEVFYDEDDSQLEKKLKVEYDSLKVEKFLVSECSNLKDNDNGNKRNYTQLSDHYGLSMEISYNKIKNTGLREYNTSLSIRPIDYDTENGEDDEKNVIFKEKEKKKETKL